MTKSRTSTKACDKPGHGQEIGHKLTDRQRGCLAYSTGLIELESIDGSPAPERRRGWD